MPFLLQAFVSLIISYALQALIQPKPKGPIAGQMEVPTAREGDNIAVVFGTCIMKQSNVVWYGDPSTVPIYQKGKKK